MQRDQFKGDDVTNNYHFEKPKTTKKHFSERKPMLQITARMEMDQKGF